MRHYINVKVIYRKNIKKVLNVSSSKSLIKVYAEKHRIELSVAVLILDRVSQKLSCEKMLQDFLQ